MTTIDPDRQGKCYVLAQQGIYYAPDARNLRLVHGSINGGKTDHAWLLTVNDDGHPVSVWDPVLNQTFPYEEYLSEARADAEATYTREEAIRYWSAAGHFGPWHETGLKGALTMLSALLRELGVEDSSVTAVCKEIDEAAKETAYGVVMSLRGTNAGIGSAPDEWRKGWDSALFAAANLLNTGDIDGKKA